MYDKKVIIGGSNVSEKSKIISSLSKVECMVACIRYDVSKFKFSNTCTRFSS